MTGQTRYRFWAGGLAALALLATACGSSDGGETASTVDANVKQGVEAALSGSSTTVVGTTTTLKEPASIAEWE